MNQHLRKLLVWADVPRAVRVAIDRGDDFEVELFINGVPYVQLLRMAVGDRIEFVEGAGTLREEDSL